MFFAAAPQTPCFCRHGLLSISLCSPALSLPISWIDHIIFRQGRPPGSPPNRRRLPAKTDDPYLHASRGSFGRTDFGLLGARPSHSPGARSLASGVAAALCTGGRSCSELMGNFARHVPSSRGAADWAGCPCGFVCRLRLEQDQRNCGVARTGPRHRAQICRGTE